jgi:TonB family protein
MFQHLRYAAVLIILIGSSGRLSAEMHVSAADALKAAVTKAPPEYPVIAKQMRVTGRVELEIKIGTEGKVEDVKVISGNALLTPAAVEAVKKWKFTPFTDGGVATKAVATLGVDFKL